MLRSIMGIFQDPLFIIIEPESAEDENTKLVNIFTTI